MIFEELVSAMSSRILRVLIELIDWNCSLESQLSSNFIYNPLEILFFEAIAKTIFSKISALLLFRLIVKFYSGVDLSGSR